jgi:hypothetical protein
MMHFSRVDLKQCLWHTTIHISFYGTGSKPKFEHSSYIQFLIITMAVGPILTMYLMRNEDDYKIWDRCYRLRNSKNQVRVDQDSVIGAIVGAGVGSYTGNGAVFGGLLGMSGGIILIFVHPVH